MIREFSAGGVVIRRMQGRAFVAVVRVREQILALPKGHPDPGESSAEAAQREVREEAGLETEPSKSSATSATGMSATASG